jgi:hypothetical protein
VPPTDSVPSTDAPLRDRYGIERELGRGGMATVRVTVRLQHADIVPLPDSGMLETAPGRCSPFYVMPYVEGESLALHSETPSCRRTPNT